MTLSCSLIQQIFWIPRVLDTIPEVSGIILTWILGFVEFILSMEKCSFNVISSFIRRDRYSGRKKLCNSLPGTSQNLCLHQKTLLAVLTSFYLNSYVYSSYYFFFLTFQGFYLVTLNWSPTYIYKTSGQISYSVTNFLLMTENQPRSNTREICLVVYSLIRQTCIWNLESL